MFRRTVGISLLTRLTVGHRTWFAPSAMKHEDFISMAIFKNIHDFPTFLKIFKEMAFCGVLGRNDNLGV
jgi:hypothetical protein